MDSVQDFKNKPELKSEGKAGYEFIGLPKSLKPIQNNYQAYSVNLADEIDNHMMSLDDSKLVANRFNDNFVATKVSDKTTLKKEKREDYKNDKIAGPYKISNN